jgi:hypothetical protein
MLLSTSTPVGTTPLTADQRRAGLEAGFSYAKALQDHPGWDHWSPDDLFIGAIIDGDIPSITEDHPQFYEVFEAFMSGVEFFQYCTWLQYCT